MTGYCCLSHPHQPFLLPNTSGHTLSVYDDHAFIDFSPTTLSPYQTTDMKFPRQDINRCFMGSLLQPDVAEIVPPDGYLSQALFLADLICQSHALAKRLTLRSL